MGLWITGLAGTHECGFIKASLRAQTPYTLMPSFAVTILQLALALLVSVQSNTAATATQREQAISVATQAIQFATQVLGQSGSSATSMRSVAQVPVPNSPTEVSSAQVPPNATDADQTLNLSLEPRVAMQSQSVAPGGTGYILVATDLTAGPSDVTVSSLNFGCGGFACNSVTDLRLIGVGPNMEAWDGSPSNGQTFTPTLTIPAGTTQIVDLLGDVSSNAPAGEEIQYSLSSLSVNLAGGGTITGSASGNVLTVTGQSNQPTVTLEVNGSTGPVTVSSGAAITLTWNSTEIPGTCTVVFNPTGATNNIAGGLSGSTTVDAPSVTILASYLYEVSCPISGLSGPSIADTVQVIVTPSSGSPGSQNP
jgi:hypothetical protein